MGTEVTTDVAAAGSVVSLPSGGGGISGLGEKFAPDLFTGTGNFSVPVVVPAGRAGLVPRLGLSYSTGNGNGPFGVGWALSLPGVARKTSRGVPRYLDAPGPAGEPADVFVVSGAEDLVPVESVSPGRIRYRPRTEGLFARIEHVRDGSGDYWEVRGKDGVLTRYGMPRPAGALADWLDPAVVADPDDPRRVFGWRITQPVLTIQPPNNVVGNDEGVATATIRGTAPDSQSGMVGDRASVEWASSPTGSRTRARPLVGNDFRDWTAEVELTGFGAHTIHVWATDQAGNTATKSVRIVVVSVLVAEKLDQRLNERQYLGALLSFAQEEVQVSETPSVPLDTATLVDVLGQPVDRLSQPPSSAADVGGREVNQLRVPVELLRAHIAATHTATGPGADGEITYRSTAYASLLAAFGTSYPELRLARGATPAARQALAARLGIRLSAGTPDEFAQLILDDANLTEAALETMFGLPASTGADPLRVPATPRLLGWQLAALALSWAEQDQHPNPNPNPLRVFAVLADPDIVGESDVAQGPGGDPIRLLLTQRAAQLTDYAHMLDGLRAGTDTTHGLAAMTATALPGVNLADLEAKDGQGIDITTALKVAGLSRSGFLYLRELARLATTGVLTPAEWSDAIAVLTAAHKRTLYPAWQAQETAFALSPDLFALGGAAPQVNAFRADGQARTAWQSVLRGRIAQRQGMIEANARAIAATEQATLPILRDALLDDLAPTTTGDLALTTTGEEMSALFLVDVLAGGTLRTTRIKQAIETVQVLLSAKRSGELASTHPAVAWSLRDPEQFPNAWAWMGDLGSWRSATIAFLFPERHLDPTLLVPHDLPPLKPLQELFNNVRDKANFSAADAIREADTYWGKVPGSVSHYLNPQRTADHQNQLLAVSARQSDPEMIREIFWAVPTLLAQRLQSAGDFQTALDWYWIVYPYDVSTTQSIYDRINTERSAPPSPPNLTFPPEWTTKLDPFTLVDTAGSPRPTPYARYTLLAIIRCHIEYGDAEFTRETDESIAHARTLYVTARRLLGTPQLQPLQPANDDEPRLAIPELDALRARADVQLAKLRQGRNIAGMPRHPGPAHEGDGAPADPVPVQNAARAGPAARRPGRPDGGWLPGRTGEVRREEPASVRHAQGHRHERRSDGPGGHPGEGGQRLGHRRRRTADQGEHHGHTRWWLSSRSNCPRPGPRAATGGSTWKTTRADSPTRRSKPPTPTSRCLPTVCGHVTGVFSYRHERAMG